MTTIPVGGPKAAKDVAPTRPTSPAMPAAESTTHTEDAHAHVAGSLSALQNTLSIGRREVEHADGKMLAELKEAIRNGTFKVNVDELAERLVADAFPDGDGG